MLPSGQYLFSDEMNPEILGIKRGSPEEGLRKTVVVF